MSDIPLTPLHPKAADKHYKFDQKLTVLFKSYFNVYLGDVFNDEEFKYFNFRGQQSKF